jgi:hypothetical protein
MRDAPNFSLVGAVEVGIALWYFTNGHWLNGTFLAIAVAFLMAVYFHRERKVKGQRGHLLGTRSAHVLAVHSRSGQVATTVQLTNCFGSSASARGEGSFADAGAPSHP